jgi:hypothetical protein
MLDLYTNAERWHDAAHVLETLADQQDMAGTRAKYLYAAAVIVRDHLDDPEESKRWMRRVLDADPLHEKAFRAEVELLTETQAWRDLSKLLRERLKALPETADAEERVGLLAALGDVYAERLEDDRTALAAYEQAVALAPSSIDPELQLERRRKVLTLAMDLGDDAVDKAIAQAQAIIATRPMEFATYHQLVELYSSASRRDAAHCVARALRFLKQANEKELELAGPGEPRFALARGTISRELWRSSLAHPSENLRLSELFGLIWPVVAAREGQTHAHFGVDRDARENVSLQATGVVKFVAYACQILDVPVPDLFLRPVEVGGFAVAALSDGKMVYPTLIARAEAVGKGAPDGALAFRAGRAVTRVMPEHILASVMSSGAGLRDAVFGAIGISQPQVAIPAESRDRAKAYGDQLRRLLPPARFDTLKALCARLVEGGGADTKAWAEGVEYTAHRVGFLLADSLELAGRIITQDGVATVVPGKDLIKDLVTFSVSEGYLRLRKELKLAK